MIQLSQRASLAATLVAAGMLIVGCTEEAYDRVPVSGKVLIDGAPLTIGYVRFIPVGGGRPAVAEISALGTFDFGEIGVVVGRQRVEVIASEQIGSTGYRWHAPEKYAAYSSSGLEQEITAPTNDLVLNLSWDGGKPITLRSSGGDDDPKNLKGRQ